MFQRVLSPNSFLKFFTTGGNGIWLHTLTYCLPWSLVTKWEAGADDSCVPVRNRQFSIFQLVSWQGGQTKKHPCRLRQNKAFMGISQNSIELSLHHRRLAVFQVCVYRLNRRKTSYTLYIYMRGVPEALMRPALTKTLISCLWYQWGRSSTYLHILSRWWEEAQPKNLISNLHVSGFSSCRII